MKKLPLLILADLVIIIKIFKGGRNMTVKKEIIRYFIIFFILTVLMFSTVIAFKDNGKIIMTNQDNTNNSETTERSSYIIDVSEDDINLLTRAVYSEARGESLKGQVAVAAVIINRVKSPAFPNNVKEVIFQPWAFTAVHDGQFWLQPDADAYTAAKYALNGWDPSDKALFYYNPAKVTSNWIYSRAVVGRIGKHTFAR